MTLPNGILTRRRDDVTSAATITVETGTPDTAYGPELLADDNPAKVSKIASTTGAWQFAFPSAQPIDLVALIHHDFDEDCQVVLQADDGPNWTSPAFEAAFTIPAWLGVGTRRWPVNPWLDLTEQAYYDPSGWQFYRLLVTSNSMNLELGQVKCYADRITLLQDLTIGASDTVSRPLVENVTTFGVNTIYGKGTMRWSREGDLLASVTQLADLQDHWHDAGGRELPWVYIPDGDVNACYLVRWTSSDRAFTIPYTMDVDLRHVKVGFEEVARGLRPGT